MLMTPQFQYNTISLFYWYCGHYRFSRPYDSYLPPQSSAILRFIAFVITPLALFRSALERRPSGRPGSIRQVSRWDSSLWESIKLNSRDTFRESWYYYPPGFMHEMWHLRLVQKHLFVLPRTEPPRRHCTSFSERHLPHSLISLFSHQNRSQMTIKLSCFSH